LARWTIEEIRGFWATQVFTPALTLVRFLYACFSNLRQALPPMADEVVAELFVRGETS
jgi:hypothetical protein